MHLAVRAGAEFVGTAVLVAVVVGSGIMAQTISSDIGVVLLLNQLSTVLGLGVLILVLLPVSGAHLNPAVTFAFVLRKEISLRDSAVYVASQFGGGLAGVALAHVMFGRMILQVSSDERLSLGTFVGEIVATTGLIAIIIVLVHRGQLSLIPLVVPAWIGAGYIFTSSTSFANPAVTLGRMFTETFTGIAPLSGVGFMGAQLTGMALALVLVMPIISEVKKKTEV